jgi:lysophospholipase L1-like esterase
MEGAAPVAVGPAAARPRAATATGHPFLRRTVTVVASLVLIAVVVGAFELAARAGCGCELFSLELRSRVAGETKQTQIPSPDGKPPLYRWIPNQELNGRPFTNNLGFVMEHDVAPTKPAGVHRLAAIGASTTQGLQLGNYPEDLQAMLSDQDSANNWEVVNAGHQGYGLKDVIALTETAVLPLAPDVLVYYGEINDVAGYKWAAYYPNGKPRLIQTSLDTYANLRKYSAFWTFTLLPIVGDNLPFTGAIEQFDWPTLLAPWKDDLEHLLDDAAQRHIRVLLVTYAYAWEPGGTVTQAMRQYSQAGGWPAMAHPVEQFRDGIAEQNRIVRQLASERGLFVAPVAEELNGKTELYSDTVHMTAAGYQRMAEIIARTLLDPSQGAAIPRPR